MSTPSPDRGRFREGSVDKNFWGYFLNRQEHNISVDKICKVVKYPPEFSGVYSGLPRKCIRRKVLQSSVIMGKTLFIQI